MAYLLDTHAFIWFLNGDNKLSAQAKKKIKSIDNLCYVSVATFWEIAIKHANNRLQLNGKFSGIMEFAVNNKIEVLNIEFLHLVQLQKVPQIHADPFDRLIIAQAIAENMSVITKDEYFSKYPINVLW